MMNFSASLLYLKIYVFILYFFFFVFSIIEKFVVNVKEKSL